MSAEKRSLKRFLLIYVISTLLLVGVGEWFYYKSKYHAQIDAQVARMSNDLKMFLSENKGMLRSIRFAGNYDIPGHIQIAVYKDGKYIFDSETLNPKKFFSIKNFG